jgi:diketogulonate reductase-like aldo/keto reductase
VTLFKSSNQKNISENMWALWWDLDSDDHQFLSEKFPGRKEVSNAVELS